MLKLKNQNVNLSPTVFHKNSLLPGKGILVLTFLFFCKSFSSTAQTKNTFALGDSTFLLNGKPLQMISGEMHCARIPEENWRDRMKMAKAMGLNTIGTYIFWNAHEEEQGKYDFRGNNNIAKFIKIAQEEGLWVVLRPSPYACAEWEFGGYPWWLLKDSSVKVRSKDPRFIAAYTKYINVLAKQLLPLQVTKGGNILMVQIENEYGSFSDDKSYMDLNRKIFRDAGFDVTLFTCDGADQMPKGYLPGYLPAVNGLEDPAQVKKLINTWHNGKGPYYIAEWYPGWFDNWGKKHATISADDAAAKLDKILAAGISINMYMFHGGTTRGFMNGANKSQTEPYSPQVSSYDYDAPLDEAGNPTEKFLKFRSVIQKHLPPGQVLPAIPVNNPTIKINDIQLSSHANLFDQLPKPIKSERPLAFEDLDQAYGFVLYRTTITKNGLLRIKELRDYAILFINGKQIGTLDRRLNQDSIMLTTLPKGAVLDILVENNGRINYGPFLIDNRHGITEKVTIDKTEVLNWEQYKLPFKNLNNIKYTSKSSLAKTPGFYKGSFNLSNTADTYINLQSFGKGFVFLNGHHLGKYWNIGPQATLFVPATWLKKGNNEIVVFDELKDKHTKIESLNQPILAQEVLPGK
jgi:beta-galactosidase